MSTYYPWIFVLSSDNNGEKIIWEKILKKVLKMTNIWLAKISFFFRELLFLCRHFTNSNFTWNKGCLFYLKYFFNFTLFWCSKKMNWNIFHVFFVIVSCVSTETVFKFHWINWNTFRFQGQVFTNTTKS